MTFVVRRTAVGSTYSTADQRKIRLTNIAANRDVARRTTGVTGPIARGIIGGIRIVRGIGIRRARQRRWWPAIMLGMEGRSGRKREANDNGGCGHCAADRPEGHSALSFVSRGCGAALPGSTLHKRQDATA